MRELEHKLAVTSRFVPARPWPLASKSEFGIQSAPLVSRESEMDASVVVAVSIVSPYLHISAHYVIVCA